MIRSKYFVILMVGVASLQLSGCTKTITQTEVREVIVEVPVTDVPGAVQAVWEEPMVDSVDVPPGLDPEGHYYRPAHREIQEIRQGRWRYNTKN